MLLYPLIAILLAACGFYIVKLTQNFYLGWVSMLAVNWYNYSLGADQGMVGSLHLSAVDGVSICLLVAGVLRTLPRMKESNTPRLLASGYLCLVVYSYLTGVFANGFTTASNEARAFVPPVAAILYFLTAPVDQESIRKYIDAYTYYAIGLLVVGFLAYAGVDVGARAWAHHVNVEDALVGRLLAAGAVTPFSACFFVTLARAMSRPTSIWYRMLPALFFGMAIYLRHRTIWMMLIGCIFCVPFVEQRLTRKVLSIGLVVTILAGTVLLLDPRIAEANSDEFAYASQNTGTFLWRLNSWAQVLEDEDQTVLTSLIGKTMGSGSWRYVPETGRYEDIAPHSEYVAEYSRVGIIGVLFIVAFLLWPLKYMLARSKRDNLSIDPSWGTWFLIVIGAVIYGFTYSIEVDVYALVAIANAIVVAHKRQEDIAPQWFALPVNHRLAE